MYRDTLKNGKRGKKDIDMEKVYELLDSGKTVKEVAKQFEVSESTLYRRHKEYQQILESESQEVEENNHDDFNEFDDSDAIYGRR